NRSPPATCRTRRRTRRPTPRSHPIRRHRLATRPHLARQPHNRTRPQTSRRRLPPLPPVRHQTQDHFHRPEGTTIMLMNFARWWETLFRRYRQEIDNECGWCGGPFDPDLSGDPDFCTDYCREAADQDDEPDAANARANHRDIDADHSTEI